MTTVFAVVCKDANGKVTAIDSIWLTKTKAFDRAAKLGPPWIAEMMEVNP